MFCQLAMPAAGEGCQSLLFLPSLLLCSGASECRYAHSALLHAQVMGGVIIRDTTWFMVSVYMEGATCRNLNLAEKSSYTAGKENPLCCKAEICAPACSLMLNIMRKGHEYFGGLNFSHLLLGNVGVPTATAFERSSLAIARIVPLGFPCIIKASVDISPAGACCRWNITLTSSLLFCSLRRIFLCIVTLCNGSWFYTQTCLCLLHLFPDLGIGWSLAGVFELEVVSRTLVDCWNLCCLAACFSDFPKPEVQASDVLLCFLKRWVIL